MRLYCTAFLFLALTQLNGVVAQETTPDITEPTVRRTLYISDKKVLLDCEAKGDPVPTYKWYKDGTIIVSDSITQVDSVTGNLTIPSFTNREEGKYQCGAQNTVNTQINPVAVSPVILVREVSLGANWPVIPTESIQKNEGAYAQLLCTDVPESVPKAKFSWFLEETGGAKNQVEEGSRIHIDDQGTLHFIYLEPSDQTNVNLYKCAIYNNILDTIRLGSPKSLAVNPMATQRHRFATATALRNDLLNATGVNISTQTVRNRLHEAGLRSRRACIRTPLTQRHRQDRLNWARAHVNWRVVDWAPVLFTDESRFCVDFTDRRARVWRRAGERYQDANVAEHDRYGGGSLMIWGGISRAGRTDLHVLRRGTMTGVRYRDEVLDVYVRPYAGAVGPDFILMDDNARPHRARVVDEYLERETIVRMDWPARSPDLNPIEHVWNMLQVAISRRPVQPTTLQELENVLIQEWNNLYLASIQNLVGSMRRRCQAVIGANGGHTRY